VKRSVVTPAHDEADPTGATVDGLPAQLTSRVQTLEAQINGTLVPFTVKLPAR
jgi:hypothetical protein